MILRSRDRRSGGEQEHAPEVPRGRRCGDRISEPAETRKRGVGLGDDAVEDEVMVTVQYLLAEPQRHGPQPTCTGYGEQGLT